MTQLYVLRQHFVSLFKHLMTVHLVVVCRGEDHVYAR